MAMDVLSSARINNAWIGSDNDEQAEIRWYKCAEGAEAFPHFHAFGSPMWEPDRDAWKVGPGVDALPFDWVTSVYPAPPGKEFHGPKEWYQTGIPQAVFDNPEPWEHEPCQPAIVPDVCSIRLCPVAIDPDHGRIEVEFLDYTA